MNKKKSTATKMLVGFLIAASFFCCKHLALAANHVTSTRLLRRSTHNRRRLISKYDNIVDVLDKLDNIGSRVGSLSFDIEAEDGDGADKADLSSSVDSTTLMLHLDEMTSAVTPNTVLYFPEQSIIYEKVNASKITFLASSPSSTHRDLTVVSVNTNSGEVNGLQLHGESGMIRNISPKNSSSPTLQLRSASESSEPRQFDCGVDHDEHRHRHMADASSHSSGHEDHGHHHHHHSHEGEHHHSRQLTDAPNLRRKATETSYNGFQIDLIVDIDRELINQNGGLQKTIEYVNFIVSTTNIILQKEFDLHLNVVKIAETAIFNDMGSGTIRDALKVMRETHTGTIGTNKGAHLRHALLGRDLGGGIAFTDGVCDGSYGFGISSGIRGKINNMDMYDVYIFAHEIGHSFGSGHTFDNMYSPPVDTCKLNSCPEGLPLTDSSTLMSYCGYFCGGMSNTALTYGGVWDQASPREDLNSWLQNPALIVSPISTEAKRISHLIWTKLSAKGECIRKHDPLIVAAFEETTTEPTKSPPSPSQVPSTSVSPTFTTAPSSQPSMQPSVSPSKVPSPTPSLSNVPSSQPTIITPKPTSDPTLTKKPADTWSPTSPPSSHPTMHPTASPSAFPSISPTSHPSFSPTVNPSNVPSNSPMKGLHSISPLPLKDCDSGCVKTNGYMFNVKLGTNAANSIKIYNVSVWHKAASIHRIVRVHTVNGGYEGKEESIESWTEIASGKVPKRHFVSTITLDQPLIINAGETVGFYLKSEEDIMFAGKVSNTEIIYDNNVKLEYGMAIVNGLFTESYSWSGSVEYEIVDN